MPNLIRQLRYIGMLEGLSFLLLLGVAMPLKYLAGEPMAVKIVGWLHGILFVAYCVALLRVVDAKEWKWSRGALYFLAALLPFGPFVADRSLRREE